MKYAIALALLVFGVPALRAQDSVGIVYLPGQVDQMPRRLSGPGFDYPPGALKGGDGERVLIEAVWDTGGHIEPPTLTIVQTPDSATNASVRATLLATVYAPAMRKGRPVRFMGQLWLVLHAQAINATALISRARQMPRGQLDSAMALLDQALDASAHPSDGERTYAFLERGVVETRLGRADSAAPDLKRGLDLWRLEHARGVELAPFLNDLADSIRLSARGARATAVGSQLVVLGNADVAPALLSRPPVVYPAEARALGVSGTVVVEVEVDSAGRVAGTPKVVESPNPILDSAAVRIVRASRYRPGRLRGRPVPVRIRQPITFRP